MFLEFVEGPLWYVAVVVFVAGVTIRLIEVLCQRGQAGPVRPAADGTAGALRTIVTRSWTAEGFTQRRDLPPDRRLHVPHRAVRPVALGRSPCRLHQDRILGFGWTPAPHWLFIVAADLAFAGLILLWLRRVMHPVMRQISTLDDHIGAILTFVVMFTGCMALFKHHDSLRAIHMLTVEMLMMYFPFSRLMHAFTFILSRGYTGAPWPARAFGR